MVLKMSSPWKHPDNGTYYYRRAVPDDLREAVGRREEKRSLGTKSPEEAKYRFAQVAAEIELKWSELRKGVQTMTRRQANAVAGDFYRSLVLKHGDDPNEAWRHRSAVMHLKAGNGLPGVRVIRSGNSSITSTMLERLADQNVPSIEKFLGERGIKLDEESFAKVKGAVDGATIQAHETLSRYADDDYSADPRADRFPPLRDIEPKRVVKVTSQELWEAYVEEANPSPATLKKWRPLLEHLVRHAGKANVRDITDDDVIGWKVSLMKSGKSSNHIRNSYLAAVKAIFNQGVQRKLVPINPAANVTAKYVEPKLLRERGLTAEEAQTILAATFDKVPARTSPEFAAARRWVPWLCAYSGARVGEITQLRAQDVEWKISGGQKILRMRITPEAGSVKNRSFRDVPIHPHIIEQGFLDYVATKNGPLFYDPLRHRGGTEGNPQYKKTSERLAAWVRKLGVDDAGVQPNHGWRHRFNSVCREAKILPEIRDKIEGHTPRTEGEKYGDLWLHVALEAIVQLPRYAV